MTFDPRKAQSQSDHKPDLTSPALREKAGSKGTPALPMPAELVTTKLVLAELVPIRQ